MKLLKAAILLLSPFAFLSAQELQFYKEELTFTLNDNSFKVDGLYYFCNTDNKPFVQQIFYPFPIDSNNFGEIDSIKAELDNMRLPFTTNGNNGIFIPLNLGAYKSTIYHIKYRQKLLKNKAEYILTSTQTWKRSLESVTYCLCTSKNINIKYFSYNPDTSVVKNGYRYYYWEKKDFFPSKNMVFEFE